MKGFPNDETGEDEDFIGVVVGMPSADLYHVVYEDGDGEDLTHAELSAVVTGTVDTAMADATGHDGTFDSDGDDDKGEPGPHPCPSPTMWERCIMCLGMSGVGVCLLGRPDGMPGACNML